MSIKEIYLSYILFCMAYHFYTVVMSYRRARMEKNTASDGRNAEAR